MLPYPREGYNAAVRVNQFEDCNSAWAKAHPTEGEAARLAALGLDDVPDVVDLFNERSQLSTDVCSQI